MALKVWEKGDIVTAADLNGNFAQSVTIIANGVSAMPTSGGIFNGPVIMSRDPVTSLEPATKHYTDTAIAAEAVARTTFDNSIAAQVITEMTARTNADTAISAQLSAEASARFNADTILTTQLGVVQATANAALPMSGGHVGPLTLADGSPAASQAYVAANAGSGGSGGATVASVQAAQTAANNAQASANNALTAAATAATQAAANVGRNRVHNGWMEVLQRGSGPFTVNGGFTADRWMAATPSGTISANVVPIPGYGPCRRVLGVAQAIAANSYVDFTQRIESYSAFDFAGQIVTVSFYGATTTTAGSIQAAIYLLVPAAPDDFSSLATVGFTNVTLTASPSRASATFSVPAGAANGLELGLRCQQLGSAGTMQFNITGVQLEIGSAPTALEARSIRYETAECQRFYKPINLWGTGYSVASGAIGFADALPVQMRRVPDLSIIHDGSSNLNAITVGALTAGEVYAMSSAATTGNFNLNVLVAVEADL